MDRKHQDKLSRFLPQLVKQVDPQMMLPFLTCLVTSSREVIDTAQSSRSRTHAVYKLYEELIRCENGWKDLIAALRHPAINKVALADLLDPPESESNESPPLSKRSRTNEVTPKKSDAAKEDAEVITKDTPVSCLNAKINRILELLDRNQSDADHFAGCLNFSFDDVERIKTQKGNESFAVMVFRKWSQRGKEATIGVLMRILRDEMQRLDVLQEIERLTQFKLPEDPELAEGSLPTSGASSTWRAAPDAMNNLNQLSGTSSRNNSGAQESKFKKQKNEPFLPKVAQTTNSPNGARFMEAENINVPFIVPGDDNFVHEKKGWSLSSGGDSMSVENEVRIVYKRTDSNDNVCKYQNVSPLSYKQMDSVEEYNNDLDEDSEPEKGFKRVEYVRQESQPPGQYAPVISNVSNLQPFEFKMDEIQASGGTHSASDGSDTSSVSLLSIGQPQNLHQSFPSSEFSSIIRKGDKDLPIPDYRGEMGDSGQMTISDCDMHLDSLVTDEDLYRGKEGDAFEEGTDHLETKVAKSCVFEADSKDVSDSGLNVDVLPVQQMIHNPPSLSDLRNEYPDLRQECNNAENHSIGDLPSLEVDGPGQNVCCRGSSEETCVLTTELREETVRGEMGEVADNSGGSSLTSSWRSWIGGATVTVALASLVYAKYK